MNQMNVTYEWKPRCYNKEVDQLSKEVLEAVSFRETVSDGEPFEFYLVFVQYTLKVAVISDKRALSIG